MKSEVKYVSILAIRHSANIYCLNIIIFQPETYSQTISFLYFFASYRTNNGIPTSLRVVLACLIIFDVIIIIIIISWQFDKNVVF